MRHANALAMMTSKLLKKIADAVLPQRCIMCRRRLLSSERHLCSECCLDLPPANIGLDAADNLMARMFWGVFPIEGATAVCSYLPGSSLSAVIHGMKYGHQPSLCRFVGKIIASNAMARTILDTADALVPVPLTPGRQAERGYNQSEQICLGISEQTGIPVLTNVLRRIRFTDSLTAMSMNERRRSICGAFGLDNQHAVEGLHIVIVDDVVTTGATISECLITMRDIPGLRASVVTFAMTNSM